MDAFNNLLEQGSQLYNIPLTGDPVADELAFQQAYNEHAAQVSNYLAEIYPAGELPPGFGPEYISQAVSENWDAFGNLMGAYQEGVYTSDAMHEMYIDTIHGVQDLYDPYTGQVWYDVPYADYYYTDLYSGTGSLFGSDTVVDNSYLTQIDPYEYYGSYGLDAYTYTYDYGSYDYAVI
ncbi:hypothetical protein IQ255_06105 [Pleurocapsales cyanobacterium LEGE 10410]|nr:hypothetical protein [Pleurocapsales cyanobacterium LEGE 10410]